MRIILILAVVLSLSCAYAKEQSQHEKQVQIFCEIQQRLEMMGFSPGQINGQANETTRKALSKFLNKIKPEKNKLLLQDVLNYLRASNLKNKSIYVKKNKPKHGTIFFSSGKKELAPLQLKTKSSGYDFFVKLSNIKTGRTVKEFYLRGGYVFNTRLPLGKYSLKYVTGKNWYSKQCLFGLNTSYSKAEMIFTFSRRGNRLSGYSVELILQPQGNLSTKRIKPEQW